MKIFEYIKHPSKILISLDSHNLIRLSDENFIKYLYKIKTNKKLNLKNPQSFNEKLQWLKLYNRNPEYNKMVDKYEAKKYVASIIGEEYIIPTIGIYDKFDEINFDNLPSQFVIKCTHDSGGLVIVKDKSNLNIDYVKEKIEKALKKNYYYHSREWIYKDIQPRIIIEKYMEDKHQKKIRDYKFFCFDGEPQYMYISEGLENHHTASMCFFDMNYNVADIQRRDYKNFDEIPSKPINFEEMKKLSSCLSKNIPHLRVDWYEINGKMYFGELTFFTCSGFIPFKESCMDKKLGDFIKLPK